MLVLAVALAGAIGAPARYLVDGFVQARSSGERPFGTFVVNVTGSFVLGFLTGLALYRVFRRRPGDSGYRVLRCVHDVFVLHV